MIYFHCIDKKLGGDGAYKSIRNKVLDLGAKVQNGLSSQPEHQRERSKTRAKVVLKSLSLNERGRIPS
jgi:hypothetical protein